MKTIIDDNNIVNTHIDDNTSDHHHIHNIHNINDTDNNTNNSDNNRDIVIGNRNNVRQSRPRNHDDNTHSMYSGYNNNDNHRNDN